MVKLKAESMKSNPDFENYLRKDFLHVRAKTHVMDAFWKWSAWANPDHWRRNYYYIFSYGSEPEIEVAGNSYIDLLCKYEHRDRKTKLLGVSYGLTPKGGKAIILHGNLVKLVEEVVIRARAGQKKPDDDRILTLMEGTIMHEMVHWSYFIMGVDEANKYGGDQEYGTTHFEQEAYGRVLEMGPEFRKSICEVRKSANFIGIRKDNSCTIIAVQPGSPAAMAGLIKGDRIRKFDGKELSWESGGALYEDILIHEKKPGDQVSLQIHRESVGNNEIFTVRLTIGSTTDDSWW